MKTITLTEAHEHDGIPRAAGTELRLTETDADWLIGAGKARAAVSTPLHTARAPTLKATESTQDKEQA